MKTNKKLREARGLRARLGGGRVIGGAARRWALGVVLGAVAIGTADCATSRGSFLIPPRGEWRTYGGTLANAKYAPLAQIDRDNVRQLRVAWRWRSPDHKSFHIV